MKPAIPPHVPGELVVDVDLYDIAGPGEDVHRAWNALSDELRNRGRPLVYSPRHGGYWIATAGDLIEQLFADDVTLSNASVSIPAHEGMTILPGEGDGEMHTLTRRAAMQWFTPKRVRALAEPIENIARTLIAEVKPRGGCEFMYEFAFKIPMLLFVNMMGLPVEDGRDLLERADHVIREGDVEKKIAAMSGVFDYLGAVVDERRRKPGEDLISQLTLARYGDEPMPREMVLSMSVNLLLGGLDTVASMLGFVVRHLAEDESLRGALAREPERIRGAVEEFARRFPVAALGRVVARDCVIAGVELRNGERLLLPTQLHGLDERRFERPLEIDLEREIPVLMSFGRGRHQCIGSLLARIELQAALKCWLAEIPDFWIPQDDPPLVACGAITSISRLPLRWETLI
jgi:cytochrome P450